MIAPTVLFILHVASSGAQTSCAACFAQSAPASAPDSAIAGAVHDATGAAVPGAVVIVRSPEGREWQTVSGSQGAFRIAGAASGPVDVIVRASGFAESRLSLAAGAARADLNIALTPASVAETVTVTATRSEQRAADVPASVTVISRSEIRQSPAVVADDMLREIPTFSLFRRTSSLAAHPTSQGVSLRGIGPSGVSRTLVLLDGVPFNDPFGGWVYWSRVPLNSADRIEVVEGSSSSLYGNYAMGGVVNIVTSPAAPRTIEVKSQYGNRKSPNIDFRASDVWGKLGIAVDGNAFDTDGYATVYAKERGPVDNNSSVTFRNVSVKADYAATDRIRAFARVGNFHEKRDNGKKSTFDNTEEGNDTTWNSASGGVRIRLADQSEIRGTAFVDDETFHSNFLAVPDATTTRATGRMTLLQTVPTRGYGGLVEWTRPTGRRHILSAGTDWRWVDGDSQETGLDATQGLTANLKRISGGTQRSLGAYAQDLFSPIDKLTITLSARVDNWRNYDAHNIEFNFPAGTPTVNNRDTLPDKKSTVGTGRAAALYHLNDHVSVWGDFGTGFRAPTLNELYRQFRVGTRLTLANSDLGPEHLRGGELGVSIAATHALTWRATWFDNRVKDPVASVFISQVGTTINVQRQNLGRSRIAGVQTDVQYRLRDWTLSGGYLYNQARVKEFAASPDLVNKYLPQVPVHRGSFQVAYVNPRWVDASVTVIASGRQFDDDANAALVSGETEPGLPAYAVLNLNLSRQVVRELDVFVSGQNLFDKVYFVGTGPSLVGSPRSVNVGVRVALRGR